MFETDDGVAIAVDNRTVELKRSEAAELREAIGSAASQRREFVRTAGEHRPDGSYRVERRGADSPGNAKVFPEFGAVVRLYERLPPEFGVEDVERAEVSGSRRGLVVRHFAEHPAFDCAIESRSPLVVAKRAVGPREPVTPAD